MTEAAQKIKPPFPYPGAKWILAPWIVENLPDHVTYFEPYFGSGAVLFNKPVTKFEIINDLDGKIVNFFQVLRRDPEKLSRAVELTPYSRQEFQECLSLRGDPLEQARRFAVRCWQGRPPVFSKTTGWKSTWSGRGTSHPGSWDQVPERLLAVARRLKNVYIHNRDALELLERAKNRPEVLVYADPPYMVDTRSAGLYDHETEENHHTALLRALNEHAGPVVLSGYDHPLYDQMLGGWERVERPTRNTFAADRTEVLWIKRAA